MKNGLITTQPDGSKFWNLNGRFHRTDGPAIEGADGTKGWWLNGQLHRTDGPAIEGADGTKEWYLNGLQRTLKQYMKELKMPKQDQVMFKLKWCCHR